MKNYCAHSTVCLVVTVVLVFNSATSVSVGRSIDPRKLLSNCAEQLLSTQEVRSFGERSERSCHDLIDGDGRALAQVCFGGRLPGTEYGEKMPFLMKFRAKEGNRLTRVSLGAYSDCTLVPNGDEKFTKTKRLSNVENFAWPLRTKALLSNRNCCESALCVVVKAQVLRNNGKILEVVPGGSCPVGKKGNGNGPTCSVMMNCVNIIRGTPESDVLDGTEFVDYIYGGAGNDVIKGLEGNDKLIGGKGDDKLIGGIGKDELLGGSGKDKLDGGGHRDTLYGGVGNDVLRGGPGFDKLWGGDGNDNLHGGADGDQLLGGDGDDVLREDSLVSGRFWFLGSGNVLKGGPGNDKLYGAEYGRAWGGSGNDKLEGSRSQYGGWGDDVLSDGPDNAFAYDFFQHGGPGDDKFENSGSFRHFEIYGGDGDDIVKNSGSFSSLEIDGEDGDDIIIIEVPKESDLDGRLVVYGGAGDDDVSLDVKGSINNFKIRGEAGNDKFTVSTPGRKPRFHVEGGEGEDTLNGVHLVEYL